MKNRGKDSKSFDILSTTSWYALSSRYDFSYNSLTRPSNNMIISKGDFFRAKRSKKAFLPTL